MRNKIFTESEQPSSITLERVSAVANPKFKLIKSFGRVLQYYDEPKFWQYSATLNSKFLSQDGTDFSSVASGISLTSEKTVMVKCLCEAVERYCNHAFFNSSVAHVGAYNQLKDAALNPRNVGAFSENQLKNKNFKKFLISNNSRFSWTEGVSLTANKKILIPSQLIYLSYPHILDEPVIYPGISTGSAGGSCLSAALVRGICEIVERDAFMIFYLNKLEPKKIALNRLKDPKIQNLLDILSRYKMEVYSFDITTDIDIPTFLSVVVDRTGFGKSIALGLKCDLNQITAIIGSIEETFNSRSWLRTEYEKGEKKVALSDLLKNSDIRTRGLLWYPVEAIDNLSFLLNAPKSKDNINAKEIKRASGQQLEHILEIFKKHEYDVLYKDITLPVFKSLNYFVTKTIIPQMQPFYLNENYKLLGGRRLYDVPKKIGFKTKLRENQLNLYPHPFL